MIPTVARVNVPFRWSIADGLQGQSMIARSYGREIAAVISRPTRKWVPDRNGLLVPYNLGSVAVGTFRGETAVLLEPQRTNLCIRSEEFDTWSDNVGGMTTTSNAARAPDGTMTMDLVAGDGSGVAQGKVRAVTFTGNGTKCVSIYLREGTGDTRVEISVFDATASAFRHTVRVTWASGVPSVQTIEGSGTIFALEGPFAGGAYRVSFTAEGIVAANTNRLIAYTAARAAAAGSVYLWGAQAEDATVPSSYIKTEGATVTRTADALYFPFIEPPQASTLYLRMVEQGTFATEFSQYVSVSSAPGDVPRLAVLSTTGASAYALHETGSGAVTSFAGVTNSRGDLLEMRVVLGADGSVLMAQTKNAGAELSGARSSLNALAGAWSAPRLYINGANSNGAAAYTHIVLANGEQSLSTMRELAGV